MPIFWKLTELGMSNMNLVIAKVIWFAYGTMITFSQGDETKIKSVKFQSLAPGLVLMHSRTTRSLIKSDQIFYPACSFSPKT